ncbi:hypothetical protein C8J57DRAFT_1523460 [Mycena rebaudengoi]|nr:hypothetical protein C8J57DRAFT_1523460 [Mycena rebaudengoi]
MTSAPHFAPCVIVLMRKMDACGASCVLPHCIQSSSNKQEASASPRTPKSAVASPKKGKGKQAANSAAKRAHTETVLEESDVRTVDALPDVCEVTEDFLQDPALAAVKAKSVSWSDVQGPGNILLGSWSEIISSNLPTRSIYSVFSFVRNEHYINLSRVDPRELQAVRQIYTTDRNRFALCVGEKPANASSVNGSTNKPTTPVLKYVTGMNHSQEFERFVGCVGVVFGEQYLHTRIAADVVTYGTKSIQPLKPSAKTPKFTGVSSPASNPGASRTSSSPITLLHTDDVPVYDGRSVPFDLQRDVKNLDAVLPRYTHS